MFIVLFTDMLISFSITTVHVYVYAIVWNVLVVYIIANLRLFEQICNFIILVAPIQFFK